MLILHNETIVGEGFLLLPVLAIALFSETLYYTFSFADPTDHGIEVIWKMYFLQCWKYESDFVVLYFL